MFKFNHEKVLEHKKLGKTQHNWVCPYKEGNNEVEWVVKYNYAKNQEEMNIILQNILLVNSANPAALVSIKGYDIQANEQGDYNIYVKMPRMHESLREVIDKHYNTNNLLGSTEKIAAILHSIAQTLDDLAQKQTFHRNLKPSNVLLDKTGHVFLSDLKMIQDSASVKELANTDSEDQIFIAPEVLSNDWVSNEEGLLKADVWSLGMIIAKLCLLEKLTPMPLDVPLQEKQEAIEANLEAIKKKCGSNFSKVIAEMLRIDPIQRKTFSEICESIEQAFIVKKKNAKDTNQCF